VCFQGTPGYDKKFLKKEKKFAIYYLTDDHMRIHRKKYYAPLWTVEGTKLFENLGSVYSEQGERLSEIQ
jgi:hypothetical protein